MSDVDDWTEVVGDYVRVAAQGRQNAGDPAFNVALQGTDRSLVVLVETGPGSAGTISAQGATSGFFYDVLLESTAISPFYSLFYLPVYGAIDASVNVNLSPVGNFLSYWLLATPRDMAQGQRITPLIVQPKDGSRWSVSLDAATLAAMTVAPQAGSRWSMSLDAGFGTAAGNPEFAQLVGPGSVVGNPLFAQLVQAAADTAAYRTRDIYHTTLVADGSYNVTPAVTTLVAAQGAGKFIYVGSVSFYNSGAGACEVILGSTVTPNPFFRANLAAGASVNFHVDHLLPANTSLTLQQNAAQTIIFDVCYGVVGTAP